MNLNIHYSIIILLIILVNFSVNGQIDSIETNRFKNICFSTELVYSNLSGNVESFMSELSESNTSALRNFNSNFGIGFKVFSEKHFNRNQRFVFRPTFGVRLINGNVTFEKNLEWMGDNLIEVKNYFSFKDLFFHTAYYVDYKLFKGRDIGFIVGLNSSARISKRNGGLKKIYIANYNSNPTIRSLLREEEIDNFDEILPIFQINFDIGLNKTFKIKKSNDLMIELRYEFPLIDSYQPLNFNINPITFSLSYKLNRS